MSKRFHFCGIGTKNATIGSMRVMVLRPMRLIS
jgi:hypothetical protein